MVSSCTLVRSTVFVFILFSFTLLNGCAHSLTKQASAEAKEACQSNVLLQKYQCSIAKVEADARSNNADAKYALGYMYYYGIDTTENIATAKLWMRRAAAQGQPQAIQALQLLESTANEQSMAVAASASTKVSAQTPKAKSSKSTTPVTNKVSVASKVAATSPADLQKSYSIQLAATVNLERLQEYVTTHHLKGQAGYYKTCIKGTKWYILIYGHYANKAEALQALHSLPTALKAQGPWIKSYRTIQQQIARGNSC